MCEKIIIFLNWLFTAEHIFTLITVVISGLISWIISALYFKKSNRNALLSDVLYPIKHILDEELSWKNYSLLSEIPKRYISKFLYKKERLAIYALISSYKLVCGYKYEIVCADSLFSYFCYKLKVNGIEPNIIPIEDDDGTIIAYDYPLDLIYMKDNLAKIIVDHPLEFDEDACSNIIELVYKSYCKEFYTDKEIVFFDDFNVNEVIDKAKNRAEWNEKFSNFERAKNDFLNLKVLKN